MWGGIASAVSDRDDVHPQFPQRSGLFIDSCPFRSRPHDRQREAKPRSWIFPPDMRYTPRLTPSAGTFRHRVVESMRYITFPVKACANAYVARAPDKRTGSSSVTGY